MQNRPMTETEVAHPPIVTREEWLQQRVALLKEEKEHTRAGDRLAAKRRRLPMVPVEKQYTFEGPEGKRSLLDLFDGRRQLIVYHFMFDPKWENGCPGCTSYVDTLGPGTIPFLRERDTSFVLVSRAPLPKLEAYKAKKGWSAPWYSSFESDFNYDFHATNDKSKAPIMYNYMDEAQLTARRGEGNVEGEDHSLSVFFRIGDEVFHTYQAFARSTESMGTGYGLLDVTPYGRQEDFEDSPTGWPQHPTYG